MFYKRGIKLCSILDLKSLLKYVLCSKMMYNLNTRHKFYEFITLYIIVFCTSSRIAHTFASTNFYLNMKREKIELNELPYQTLA